MSQTSSQTSSQTRHLSFTGTIEAFTGVVQALYVYLTNDFYFPESDRKQWDLAASNEIAWGGAFQFLNSLSAKGAYTESQSR